MKAALALMVLLLGVLLVLVWRAGRWGELVAESQRQALGLVPLLVVAVLLAAAVQVLLPEHTVQLWLGRASGLRGVVIAWLGGILTPLGGPVGLPLVATLARKGASLPVLLTWLLSMSTLSLLRIPIEWALLGGRLTALRVAASFLLPPLVGAGAMLVLKLVR